MPSLPTNRRTAAGAAARLRVGDRERAAAADRLAAHAAAGRLSVDELEARLDRVHAAVFSDELTAVEADLPAVHARPPARGRPAVPLLVACAAALVLATVAVGHPVLPPFLILLWLVWRGRPARAVTSRSYS